MVTRKQIDNIFPTSGETYRNMSVIASVEAYKLVGITPAIGYDEAVLNRIRYEYPVETLLGCEKLTPEGLFALSDAGWWRDGDKIVFQLTS